MARASIVAVLLILGTALPTSASAQAPPRKLQLVFEADGTVSLEAASVSTGEVMLEWARLCGCIIVNAQNLPGTIDVPVSFDHKPQQVVLASLLRRASGYALAPRRPNMTGPSDFGTIYVLPTSQATTSAAYSVPPPAYTPIAPPTAGSAADEIPPITPLPTLPQPGAAAAAPAPAAQPAPRPGTAPGTPSRFVPIVAIPPTGASPSPAPTSPGTPTPGAPTPGAPSTGNTNPPAPIVTPR